MACRSGGARRAGARRRSVPVSWRMSMTPDGSAVAFVCYTRFDAENDAGLKALPERLQSEVRAQGETSFRFFRDEEGVQWGEQWRDRLDRSLQESIFLIPIVTPTFFQRPECRREYEDFQEIERKRGRNDLILPIYFIPAPQITAAQQIPPPADADPIAIDLCKRQWEDLWAFRGTDITTGPSKRPIIDLASKLITALKRTRTTVPQASSEGGLYVKAGDPAFIPSIGQALERATAGSTIEVGEGVYEEQLVISQPVKIVGRGDRSRIILRAAKGPAVTVRADGGALEGITVDCLGKEEAGAIVQHSSHFLVNNCHVQTKGTACIEVKSKARIDIQRCHLGPSGLYGIWVYGHGAAGLFDSTLAGNTRGDIAAMNWSKVTAHRNVITARNRAVFTWTLGEPAVLDLQDNDISEPQKG